MCLFSFNKLILTYLIPFYPAPLTFRLWTLIAYPALIVSQLQYDPDRCGQTPEYFPTLQYKSVLLAVRLQNMMIKFEASY